MSLYQFGWEQCQPSHSYGPAARNHYLFHYVISGTGTLMADDTSGITQTYSVKSGQGFIGHNTELGGLVLDEHAHSVGEHQHPYQQVAVARAPDVMLAATLPGST